MQEIQSITCKSIGAVKFNLAAGETREIFRFMGVATGITARDTAYGESLRINGDLIAVNSATGETYVATQAYMPDRITQCIVLGISQQRARGIRTPAVEFSFIASAKQMEARAPGAPEFEWVIENLAAAEETKETVAMRLLKHSMSSRPVAAPSDAAPVEMAPPPNEKAKK